MWKQKGQEQSKQVHLNLEFKQHSEGLVKLKLCFLSFPSTSPFPPALEQFPHSHLSQQPETGQNRSVEFPSSLGFTFPSFSCQLSLKKLH